MLKNVGLCLVEPAFGINVGYVARLCMNFGVKKLILTSPKFDLEVARRYAMAGSRYIEGAQIYESLNSVIQQEKPSIVVATTSITAKRPANILRSAIGPRWLATKVLSQARYALLVFGRESTGLTNREIELCDITVSIDTGTRYKTLNISHAVSIILYELYMARRRRRRRSTPDRQLVERTLSLLGELASEVTLEKHRLPIFLRAMRHLLTRAQPERREITLLLGFLRKVGWKLRTQATSNFQ